MIDYTYLIPFLTFFSVMTIGGAVLIGVVGRRRILQARLRGVQLDDGRHAGRPAVVDALSKVGTAVSSNKSTGVLEAQMARAGFHSRTAIPIYLGAKTFLFFTGVVLFSLVASFIEMQAGMKLLLVVSGAAALFFVPNMYVELRYRARAREVRRRLPDVVDLLEINISAGMGIDESWNSVTSEMAEVSPLLADEMALTNLEMNLGADRGSALRNMADRTGSDELAMLVAALVQSERFGTSIAETLRTFATSMREERSQKAEESAEKMAVKMLFPMVVLIFPVVIIVAIGPACITITDILSNT